MPDVSARYGSDQMLGNHETADHIGLSLEPVLGLVHPAQPTLWAPPGFR